MLHLITGATGFLGSHFISTLLKNTSDTFVTFARSSKTMAAPQRVIDALVVANDGHLVDVTNLTVMEVDITLPSFGLKDETLTELRQQDGKKVFWHFAASLNWEPGRRESVFKNNVTGTQHALEVASAVDAEIFVYVSTAYTAGTLEGEIDEALHDTVKSFNNVYEESKNAAEWLVHQTAKSGTMRCIIMRPSIIVGTSHNFKASGSYTGLYGIVRELRRFRKRLGDSTEIVRYRADRSARLSFIPVDHVVEDLLTAFKAELESPTHQIYHITSQDWNGAPTVGELSDFLNEKLDAVGRISLVEQVVENPTPLERFFQTRMDFFTAYLNSRKNFKRTLSSDRRMSTQAIKQYIESELRVDA